MLSRIIKCGIIVQSQIFTKPDKAFNEKLLDKTISVPHLYHEQINKCIPMN
jgi:hypothetical protein